MATKPASGEQRDDQSAAEERSEDGEDGIREVVSQLQQRVEKLELENEHLRDRVEELEKKEEDSPNFYWDGDGIQGEDLKVKLPAVDFDYPIGKVAKDLPGAFDKSDFTQLWKDVQALKKGNIDELDMVTGAEPEIPIENDLAKLGNEHLEDDLTANEKRAAIIFRKFGGRSKAWSGTLRLESADVSQMLEEQEGKKPNNNTVSRAMRMAAKKTSGLAKGDRDPHDKENNLLWVEKGDKYLELRAEKGEWLDFMEEVEERYSG